MGKINELLKQLQIESVGQPEGGNPEAVAEELSRKYYVAIAAVLRDTGSTKAEVARGLADLFARDNPRFDWGRFMTAAGFPTIHAESGVKEDGAAGFDAWMNRVNAEVEKISGTSTSDLPDVPYRDWYDDGLAPSRAARRAIKSAEMGENADKKDAPRPSNFAPKTNPQVNKDVDRAARDFDYEKKWGKPR